MKEYTLDFLTTTAIKYGTRIFWTAVIVFVGLRVIRMVRTAAGQIMDRAGVEITLKKFLDMLLHAVLFGVMVFMAADQLGIKTTSFVAVIGTVTLAFSLAMQNTLSNFAGGTLILLLKPFKVGDYISTSAGEGRDDRSCIHDTFDDRQPRDHDPEQLGIERTAHKPHENGKTPPDHQRRDRIFLGSLKGEKCSETDL